jgi:glucokinase
VLTLGIDVGGTKLLGVAATGSGEVVAEWLAPTPRGPEAVMDALGAMVTGLRDDAPEASAVGVGIAGLIDLDGVVHYAPNLAGFEGVPARTRLEKDTGLHVVVDNDANVAALGELTYGAAKGRSDVLLITLGTGIGGGVVTGGQVYRGAHGMAAEIGHFTVDPRGPRCACGGTGHWEALASGTALGRMGRERAARGEAPGLLARAGGDAEAVTGRLVGDAAQAGEPESLEIMARYADLVAMGLGGLVNILDPEVVVVAGGLVELGDVLLRPLRQALAGYVEAPHRRTLPAVVAAQLGERAGAVGAAVLARELG